MVLKLCDRCFSVGDHVKSTDTIKIESTQEVFDLCESCSQTVRDLILTKEIEKCQKN